VLVPLAISRLYFEGITKLAAASRTVTINKTSRLFLTHQSFHYRPPGDIPP